MECIYRHVGICIGSVCPYRRLRQFPSGLGKGHDCAVLLSWLEHFTAGFDVTTLASLKRFDQTDFVLWPPCIWYCMVRAP